MKKPRPITFYRLDKTIKIIAYTPTVFKCTIGDYTFDIKYNIYEINKNKTIQKEYNKVYMQVCFIRSSHKYKTFVYKYKNYFKDTIMFCTEELYNL